MTFFMIQNLFHNLSHVQMNRFNQVLARNTGHGDLVEVQWIDAAAGKANLLDIATNMFITISEVGQVVGSVNPQLLHLNVQGDGSFVIHAVGDAVKRLVLDEPSGPITSGPTPLADAADFNKQFWVLVEL
ncbi:hypothetical protein DEU56DRAFT_898342 [Suillus clintonianus]|uniref:uncharacterized protein n=1 Tax=Suillus clintonianus TaxID=1904413 RepID=UPI001B881F28|nr:uncharacterized protein DEU56DRAFT_898342 [Suillus clintonianus]KAG2152732.1 hypothetical protein DEU56DRAFT_898342 [Suillus clintonianus]